MLLDKLVLFIQNTGFANLTLGQVVMMAIASFLLYLAVEKKYEPLLLVPISFGMLLVNFPLGGLMSPPGDGQLGGLLWYLFQGVDLGIYPPLIFLGVGALTDFGPLIANPKTFLLGAAAQFGIFTTLIGALLLGFTASEAGSIGIIGGADGPTAIFLTANLAPHLLGSIAIAAYSY
ncbi:MAG: glutaconyl-CoA decarboxylase subunit beta, partial [Firmicutes bacterium HGW-Firmicutes-13]